MSVVLLVFNKDKDRVIVRNNDNSDVPMLLEIDPNNMEQDADAALRLSRNVGLQGVCGGNIKFVRRNQFSTIKNGKSSVGSTSVYVHVADEEIMLESNNYSLLQTKYVIALLWAIGEFQCAALVAEASRAVKQGHVIVNSSLCIE